MGRGMTACNGGPLLKPIYDPYAVNGSVYPDIEPLQVARGDRVKMRLLNASWASTYDLRPAGHPLTVTHADGRPIRPIETDVLRIGTGERYDVEFAANHPGNWLLGAYENGTGTGRLRIPVTYKDIQATEPEPPLFPPGLRFASYRDFRALRPRTETPDSGGRFFPQTLSGGMHSPSWTINGQAYPGTESLVVLFSICPCLDSIFRKPYLSEIPGS